MSLSSNDGKPDVLFIFMTSYVVSIWMYECILIIAAVLWRLLPYAVFLTYF